MYSLFSEIILRFYVTWCVVLSASYLIIQWSKALLHKNSWSSALSKWKCFWTCLSLNKMCYYLLWNLCQVHFLGQQVWNRSKWYLLCDDTAYSLNIPHWIRHSMPLKIVSQMLFNCNTRVDGACYLKYVFYFNIDNWDIKYTNNNYFPNLHCMS